MSGQLRAGVQFPWSSFLELWISPHPLLSSSKGNRIYFSSVIQMRWISRTVGSPLNPGTPVQHMPGQSFWLKRCLLYQSRFAMRIFRKMDDRMKSGCRDKYRVKYFIPIRRHSDIPLVHRGIDEAICKRSGLPVDYPWCLFVKPHKKENRENQEPAHKLDFIEYNFSTSK